MNFLWQKLNFLWQTINFLDRKSIFCGTFVIKLNFLWRKLNFEQQDGQKISQVLTLWTVNTYFSHILAEIDEIHGKICDFYEIYGKTIILQLQNCSKPQGVICNVDETQT